MPPDINLLMAMRDPADAGPAADHLAETGANLAEALRLFADTTLSREALAEFCPQCSEIADGTARREAVLAVWFPEVEVLVENILVTIDPSAIERDLTGMTERVRSDVSVLIDRKVGYLSYYAEAREEVDAAIKAFRRRVLRLFPEYERRIDHTVNLSVVREDNLIPIPELSSLDPERLSWTNPFVRQLVAAKVFAERLPVSLRMDVLTQCFYFWQDQPAEYLVHPEPPATWQVGDWINLTDTRRPFQNLSIRWKNTNDGNAMVLRRLTSDGILHLRRKDGSRFVIYGIRQPP